MVAGSNPVSLVAEPSAWLSLVPDQSRAETLISLTIALLVGNTVSLYLYVRWGKEFSRAFRRLIHLKDVDYDQNILAYMKASRAKRKHKIALGCLSVLYLTGIILSHTLAFEGLLKLVALALPSLFFLSAFVAVMRISSGDNRFEEIIEEEKWRRISEFSRRR
jgi:hypothetical protein